MKYKYLVSSILLILLLNGYTPEYIDSQDDVVDAHEKKIKDIYIDTGFTEDEVKELEIEYIGEVEGYLFYKTSGIDNVYSNEYTVNEVKISSRYRQNLFCF